MDDGDRYNSKTQKKQICGKNQRGTCKQQKKNYRWLLETSVDIENLLILRAFKPYRLTLYTLQTSSRQFHTNDGFDNFYLYSYDR